ncbi:MAG: hypothetical protein Q8M29_11185 [Bacteroidota bacterium]|nr:hypothetical protein [Bacteroidota bacterium]
MKKVLLSLSLAQLLFFTIKGQSRYAIAGVPGQVYVDIVPDTLINYNLSYHVLLTESYFFDINNDAQNDIEINATSINALGGGNNYIEVRPLNQSTYIRFGRFDSVYSAYNGYWWVLKVAKPLLPGDTINSLFSVWNNTTLSITDNSTMTGAGHSIYDWLSTNDKYIGINYASGSFNIYG